MGAADQITQPVLFFDGVCNLCNASVQFIIKRDKTGSIKFASLQSQYAKRELPAALADPKNLQSLVWKEGEAIRTKSTAALTAAKKLGGGWSLLYGFIILPKFIRDFMYDIIAKNRYRWFGRKEECMIPTQELKSRFIE